MICLLCRGKAVQHLQLPHTTTWRCRASNCGLEFASPQVRDDELRRIYTASYYPSTDNTRPVEYEPTDDSVVRQVLLQLEASLGSLKGLRSEEHTSELQSLTNLVCRLLLEKKKIIIRN